MDGKINARVVPGDVVGRITAEQEVLRLGGGLVQDNENVIATKAGILRFKAPNKYWVENTQRRYVPAVDDMVVGVVLDRVGENYKVDIGGAHNASLPILGFEGASKKNRPILTSGSLVYGRVTLANKDMDPEIVCTNVAGKSAGFGELKDGYLFKANLGLCRALLANDCLVLTLLGGRIPFEIAVGVNGKVWINSGSTTSTVLLTNAILASDGLSAGATQRLVREMLARA